jgi:hypothetical protein
MAYTSKNFKTKKELKEAVKKGERISVYDPGFTITPQNGVVYLEGPHYPELHTWYAKGHVRNGLLVKVE